MQTWPNIADIFWRKWKIIYEKDLISYTLCSRHKACEEEELLNQKERNDSNDLKKSSFL